MRVIEAADAERRRIERDLHDGAQQRLISIALQLRLAVARGPGAGDADLGTAVRTAVDELAAVVDEVRDLARGIHPAILTESGLQAALESLVDRSALDVRTDLAIAVEPSAAAASAAYFCVSEAMTNIAKHARARHVVLRARSDAEWLEVEVGDDGVGGTSGAAGGNGAGRHAGPRRRGGRHGGRRLANRRRDDRPGGAPMRVVLADDSVLLRSGIAELLRLDGLDVVAEVGTAEELLEAVRSTRPDVAVVDVRMPPSHTVEGLVAAREIRREWGSRVGILVLSQYVETRHATELLAEAPDGLGYLLKDQVLRPEDLVEAVRRVGSGGSALDPVVVSHLLRRRRDDTRLATLTPRELEVLALMAEGRSNRSVAGQLYLSEKTVEAATTRIFDKLGLAATAESHRRVQAVLTWLQAGSVT